MALNKKIVFIGHPMSFASFRKKANTMRQIICISSHKEKGGFKTDMELFAELQPLFQAGSIKRIALEKDMIVNESLAILGQNIFNVKVEEVKIKGVMEEIQRRDQETGLFGLARDLMAV